MSNTWALIRVVVLGIALVVVTALLWRQGTDPRLRIVLIAAFVLYGVRLYLVAADARRRARRERRIGGSDG